MTSFRQIGANRRNALSSTGPKTENGKRRSRHNAVRHGLTAETVVVALEDIEDYQAFEAAVIADYDARTAVERELVLRLASPQWRIRRATAIETDLLSATTRAIAPASRRAVCPNRSGQCSCGFRSAPFFLRCAGDARPLCVDLSLARGICCQGRHKGRPMKRVGGFPLRDSDFVELAGFAQTRQQTPAMLARELIRIIARDHLFVAVLDDDGIPQRRPGRPRKAAPSIAARPRPTSCGGSWRRARTCSPQCRRSPGARCNNKKATARVRSPPRSVHRYISAIGKVIRRN